MESRSQLATAVLEALHEGIAGWRHPFNVMPELAPTFGKFFTGEPLTDAEADYGELDAIIKATGVKITHHYRVVKPRCDRPPLDRILMPPRSRFWNERQYQASRIHEVLHYLESHGVGWIGTDHQSELACEIGTGFLESHLRLPPDQDNANIEKWLPMWAEGIEADPGYLFDAAVERFGRLDILVNNAGVMFTKPVAEVGEEEFDRLFAVNVKGTFFCCQEAAKRMADGGRVVNFSSSTTALMLPGYAAYVATKGAVEQLSHVLAKELGPKGITVNVVSPGPTDTELFGQGKTEEQKQAFARMAALGRLGTPGDIAAVVAMLVGPDAGWVTGQNVRANGGLI